MSSAGPVAYVAVVGPGEVAEQAILDDARAVGTQLARRGVVVVTGGLGGVMAAACRGAHDAGGTTLGILPGSDRAAANQWVTVAVATGLGELRNGLVVRAADAVIAVAGEYGTLSEIALALKAAGAGADACARPSAAAHCPRGSCAESLHCTRRTAHVAT
jgi:uncharacterized protein (TIGR00725 family)